MEKITIVITPKKILFFLVGILIVVSIILIWKFYIPKPKPQNTNTAPPVPTITKVAPKGKNTQSIKK